jgi:amino acid adenylation domain-containing protein
LYHDLASRPAGERAAAVDRILAEDGRRLFDLEHGPAAVFQIIRRAPEDHLFVFSVNMLFCDGWGYAVILEEIATVYSALVAGTEARLGPVVAMRQYHSWQQLPEQRAAARRAEDFWVERFRTVPPPLDLPTPHARPAVRTYGAARHSLHLPEAFCNEIRQTARRLGATPFALYFAAYQVWLHRLTEATDLVIGVPFAGQAGMGGENVVGQCVHTLPLRGAIDPAAPFATVLHKARDLILDAQENWNTTFGAVAQRLELPRDASRIPLVSVIFNLDPPLSRVQFKGLRRQVAAGPRHYFQYDLGFNLVDEGNSLTVECDYSTALLDGEWVRIWLGHFHTLLRGIVANPQAPVMELPMLSLEESERMLTGWNDTRRALELPVDGGVHGLVSAQAARTPDGVALEFNGASTTYRELDSKVAEMAALLTRRGVGDGALVALCVERSTELVIALLAILRAGAAYVPIDPDLPPARIQFMLQDAAPALIVTQRSMEDRFEGTGLPRLRVDALPGEEPPPGAAVTRVGTGNGSSVADSLAYLIYTSGSTGVPKGVEITHASVVNFLDSMRREPGVSASDAVLALTRVSFDIAVLELLLPLVVGAKVVIAAREATVDPALLSALIARSGITVMQATPATYRMLLAAGWAGGSRLRLLCGGEAMPLDLAADLAGRSRELWNLYGPAETTIWSTVARVRPGDTISIGRPIANTSVYVVDPRMRPVPVGVAGELLLGGAGLARGYRNQPRLTGERFVASPFCAVPGERVYRTGDVARFLPDGRLQFLGRRDQQVKIRGYRVELGEIESVLLAQSSVHEVVVTSREDGPDVRILVAYLVPTDPGALEGEARAALIMSLRTALRAALPEYMVPSAFVVLPALPHSANGKIDRRALPAPEGERLEVQDGYVAPATPTQEKLARMWTEILKIDRVGIRDNFFDLGGQSLRAVALFGRIERDFGRKLPLATLFSCPTIESLARRLDDSEARPELERWASLVPIQTQGRGKPLFLVHGAGGNVLLYQALAARMAPDYPLYGLQSQGLDGQTAPLRTVEEMAVHYLEEVRRVQPKGPYYLGGYCMGGTIAYEMAQRLLQEGETVALVAMLDTYNFALMLKGRSAVFLLEKLRFHLGNFVRLRPSLMWEYFKEKLRVAMDGEWINLLGYKGTGDADSQSSAQASVQAINDRAGEIYSPRAFPGTLTLFKPRVNYSCYPDPNMGWKDLVQGRLEIVELPVNPHAMLVEPFVERLAETLKAKLEPLPPQRGQAGTSGTASRGAGQHADLRK